MMTAFVNIYTNDGSKVLTCAVPFAQGEKIATVKETALGYLKLKDVPGKLTSMNGTPLSDCDLVDGVIADGDCVQLYVNKENITEDVLEAADYCAQLPQYGISVTKALAQIKEKTCIELDGNNLTLETLMKIGEGEYKVKLAESAIKFVNSSRKVVDDLVAGNEVVYGVTTGFGGFADKTISAEQTGELQENLIRSHSCGVGPPLTLSQTRRLLALRINVLAKGFCGARLETIQQLIDALNESCLPLIPEKGTVGASGDLAPLAHLALGLMGEGMMWSPKCGWTTAELALKAHDLTPLKLKAKEGLSLINGTQLITAIGSEALCRAEMIAKQADIVAALTLEAVQGTPAAFDKDVHDCRPHNGQGIVAERMRALLNYKVKSSEIGEGCTRIQDAYTLRCIPQVHGIALDTIDFVKKIILTEINSGLDNPIVLADRREIISAGNFHGEYPAKALDYLAIGIHELANISERRTDRLMNPSLNEKILPAFLVKEGGLNSGFMIAHYTAASLVSENKVLTHPSSVDSLTTSAGQEDHVSMGGFAARKALRVVCHVEQVLAIELLSACQALEFHRPKTTTAPLEKVYKEVRKVAKKLDKDRFMSPDIDAVTKLLREGKLWKAVEPDLEKYKRGY